MRQGPGGGGGGGIRHCKHILIPRRTNKAPRGDLAHTDRGPAATGNNGFVHADKLELCMTGPDAGIDKRPVLRSACLLLWKGLHASPGMARHA